MKIILSTNNHRREHNGKISSLGGSWIVLYCMARELAKYGHKVYCFVNAENKSGEGIEVDGYKIIDRKWLKHFLSKHSIDIYIAEREMVIDRHKYNIKKVFYHLHSTSLAEHPGELMKWLRAKLIDKVIFVSEWQRNLALKKKFPIKNTYIIRNGFDLLKVKGKKKNNQIIWASNPKRGLKVLAEQIFPELKKVMPEMELHVAGGHKIYNFYDADAERKDVESFGCLYKGKFGGELKDGYFYHGTLEQPELAQFFHEGTLLVYPLTNFSETGSIVVVQSQGYLTPVITRDRCVMPELIGKNEKEGFPIGDRGILVDNNDNINKWLSHIKYALKENMLYNILQYNCKKWRENYFWENIMEPVCKDFKKFIEEK